MGWPSLPTDSLPTGVPMGKSCKAWSLDATSRAPSMGGPVAGATNGTAGSCPAEYSPSVPAGRRALGVGPGCPAVGGRPVGGPAEALGRAPLPQVVPGPAGALASRRQKHLRSTCPGFDSLYAYQKQEDVVQHYLGSSTLTCGDISLHVLLGSVDSTRTCKRDTLQLPYHCTSSAKSTISQQSHHHVGDGSTHSGGAVVLLQAQIRCFKTMYVHLRLSSETGSPADSFHCLGFHRKWRSASEKP